MAYEYGLSWASVAAIRPVERANFLDLRESPIATGTQNSPASDVPAGWLGPYGYRNRWWRLRVFLSELTVSTDHRNHGFNFWVTRPTRAR